MAKMQMSTAGPGLYEVHEVLDQDDRPVCLLSLPEILAQSLRHEAVGVMLLDMRGHFLLRRNEAGLALAAYGALPASQSRQEYAAWLAADFFAPAASQLRFRASVQPGGAYARAKIALFDLCLADRMLATLAAGNESLLLADRTDLLALAGLGYIFDPLLRNWNLPE